MKLFIMFLVGLALTGGSAWYMLSGAVPTIEDKMILAIPTVIGVVLMLLSGSAGLRKFNNYLDN